MMTSRILNLWFLLFMCKELCSQRNYLRIYLVFICFMSYLSPVYNGPFPCLHNVYMYVNTYIHTCTYMAFYFW